MFKTKKIYYLLNNGEVIWDVAYRVSKTPNLEEDYQNSMILQKYDKTALGLIILTESQYAQDFIESQGNYRVNPETKELEFSYPDPNEPEVEQPYQEPLSEQIELLKAQNKAMSERADFVEDVVAEIAVQVYR